MRFYTTPHEYSCGIDLHAKTMYVCIVDKNGNKVLHRNIRNDGRYFLKLIEPFGKDIVVATESTFNWYWLADICADAEVTFILGHALYMTAIHGAKTKNDKIDSEKCARILRGGLLPVAYAYPREMRVVRDLMRRRSYFVRQRATLLAHLELLRLQYNLSPFELNRRTQLGRTKAIETFAGQFVQRAAVADVAAANALDPLIRNLEKEILKAAMVHDKESFELLKSVKGIGDVLALTLMYEIHSIDRFPRVQQFLSYSRLVKCERTSGGKSYGVKGAKMGNVHLKWAFSEAAVHFLVGNEPGQRYLQKLQRKHGKAKALTILACRLGRAVYLVLKEKKTFDMTKFLN